MAAPSDGDSWRYVSGPPNLDSDSRPPSPLAGEPAEILDLDISDLSIVSRHDDDGAILPSTAAGLAEPRPVVAFDITSKFRAACQTLEKGELIKDGLFTLFEGVGALEIMDPKMDSGCLAPGDSLDETYDVRVPISAEEVIGIIDQLICHEMAWHMGYPLSQTVFTCVYIEEMLIPEPANLNDAHFLRDTDWFSISPMHTVLRAYCVGLIKTCGLVIQTIIEEQYYEEEDMVTNTYNRRLFDQFDIEAVKGMITSALDTLHFTTDLSKELIEALDQRLWLRLTFLAAIESTQHKEDPERMIRSWEEGTVILEKVESSHEQGVPVDSAFSAKLQRKLASTMPPRPIVKLEFEEAFKSLSRLFKDGTEITKVLKYSDPQSLQTFIRLFHAQKPQPLVYIRTLIQGLVCKEMVVLGNMSIRQLIDDDLALVCLPNSPLLDRANDDVEVPTDARFICADKMEAFRRRAAISFFEAIRVMCQNRSRMRRALCHLVLEWDNLQFEAEAMDQVIIDAMKERPHKTQNANGEVMEVYALPLTSWAFLYKNNYMELIVQLGFELEIYQVGEMAGMYWYLSHLARTRVQHCKRMQSVALRALEEESRKPASKNKKIEQERARQLTRNGRYLQLSLLDAMATQELSDALSCLYEIFYRLDLIPRPEYPYSSDERRFELRMKPFFNIGSPVMPTFAEFTACSLQSDATTPTLIEHAAAALVSAKKAFEAMSRMDEADAFSIGCHDRWVPRVRNSFKACISGGIAIASLREAMKKAGPDGDLRLKARVPTPAQSYHEWWIVPQATSIKP